MEYKSVALASGVHALLPECVIGLVSLQYIMDSVFTAKSQMRFCFMTDLKGSQHFDPIVSGHERVLHMLDKLLKIIVVQQSSEV
jgi:hypothetical protein